MVVGLGNPGPRYANTRHNVGFRVVERFAAQLGMPLEPDTRFEGRFGLGWLAVPQPDVDAAEPAAPPPPPLEVGALLPQTFMNRSGRAVAATLAAHPELRAGDDLLVVFDDLDLPFGRLRLRPSGGPGGHNGLGDILDTLETRSVPRLRFGIGRPEAGVDPVEYVLSPFSDGEEAELPGLVASAADALVECLELGVESAMNRVNRARELQL